MPEKKTDDNFLDDQRQNKPWNDGNERQSDKPCVVLLDMTVLKS